jgi:hypothetical protein
LHDRVDGIKLPSNKKRSFFFAFRGLVTLFRYKFLVLFACPRVMQSCGECVNHNQGGSVMAYNGVGFGTIGPGGVQQWFISYGGSDHGAQSIHANPLNPGATLQVNNQRKTRNNDGSVTYWVTITNVSGLTTNFNLEGGGYA